MAKGCMIAESLAYLIPMMNYELSKIRERSSGRFNEKQTTGNPLHSALLAYPAPAKSVSAKRGLWRSCYGDSTVFDSYPEGDLRKEEGVFITHRKKRWIIQVWSILEACSSINTGINKLLKPESQALILRCYAMPMYCS